MPQVSQESKKARVRAFLVARPEWSHQRIADECNTTRGYVDQQSAAMRREKISRPNRSRAPRQDATEPLTDSEPSPSETTSMSPTGLRLVSIQRLTPRVVKSAAPEEPAWKCSDCGHEGTGKVPEACPKCGGA